MNAQDLLFELGTEELPPRALPSLSAALTEGIVKGLDAAGIAHGRAHGYATPRRLAVRIQKLAAQQPDKEVERRGPPLKNSFDPQGAPTQAAMAFAKNCGVAVTDLARLETDKGAWLVFRGTERGAATATLLGDIINQAVAALPSPKRMRWGAGTVEFVRPVHSVVLLYGETVVPVSVLGLPSGRVTFGHRFLAPRPITLQSAANYAGRLRRAKVVADFETRRELIRAGVTAAAAASGGTALIDDALLDEVTALVEWPVPIAGRFEQRFLRLPREVVIATVQDHQRYFAVQGADGNLSGWFVTISNIESRDPSKVREGNERVVRPRLSDAAFFWEQDRKLPLDAHAAKLGGVTFQAKLGTYADKTQRVKALAQVIGSRIGAGTCVARAAELAKADLMTAMVGEFPELQGTMGRYYAEAQGEPEELALALEEHYRPRYAGDSLPTTKTGQAVALADKIDTLVGIFAIEQRPTGTKDPFGLRRAALGVLRILLEGRLELDLVELLERAAAAQPVQKTGVVDEVYDFIAERLRGTLLEEPGTTAEMLDAVFAKRPRSPLDAVTRLAALKEFLLLPEAGILAAINKRIANILKKSSLGVDMAVNAAALTEDAERQLHRVLGSLRMPVEEAAAERRYAQSLKALVALRAPVDDFFERIMVMDDDIERRNNRLALLRDVQMLLGGVADLSRLPG
ncbi:MAG TPA: glycine--tRNA ligase subunit beta [Steroidobacteraceae bacterium]